VSSINGFSDVILDWDSLIVAYREHADIVVGADEERAALEWARGEAFRLKCLQDSLQAQRQEATQQLNQIIRQGKEVAIRLRSLARHKLGPKNELLTMFRVAPIRKQRRRRRAAQESLAPAPTPE
jgi:hypothetical protein